MVTSVYRCKKCGLSLFNNNHLIEHLQNDKIYKNQSNYIECTSIFISQMSWMDKFWEEEGKINCPNPKCYAKIGYYSWYGIRCSCGFWQTPAFQIHKSRIDYLPDSNQKFRVNMDFFEKQD